MDEKKLKLNTDKPQIMKFRKGGKRRDRRTWRWKEKMIEEVKKFKYLEYMLKQNRGQKGTE